MLPMPVRLFVTLELNKKFFCRFVAMKKKNCFVIFALRMKFLYLLQKKNPHELRHDTKKKKCLWSMVCLVIIYVRKYF